MPGTPLIELAPSILSADFAHLADQVQLAAEGGASVIHVDVMDGHFVPNITLGPPVVKSLRKIHRFAPGLPPDDRESRSIHSRLRGGWGRLDIGSSGSLHGT